MLSSAASKVFRPLVRRRVFAAGFSSIAQEDRWESKFIALKEHIEKNGDATDLDDPSLAPWLSKQRSMYQREDPALTKERTKRLSSLGVALDLHEESWEQQFEKLKTFVDLHGHCNVRVKDDEQLHNWVQRQRKIERGVVQGRMTEDRRNKLEEIDFSFDAHKAAWMEKYDELCEYRNYHGDCMIPLQYPSNPSLGVWVDQQRQHYSRRMSGRTKHSMTDERVQLLDAIDFCWNAQDARWLIQFEELKDHVRVNGFGKPPPKSSKQLTSWLNYQKKLYKLHQDGKSVSLSEGDRLQKLRSLGFCL